MFELRKRTEKVEKDGNFSHAPEAVELIDKAIGDAKALSKSARPFFSNWPIASLRVYLIVVILLATVPIATLMAYQIFEQVRSQQARLREDIQRSAAVLAQSVNRELASSVEALNILSYSGEIQRNEIDQFEQALLKRPLLRQSWSGVYLVGMDGSILFDTSRPGQPQPRMHDVSGVLHRLSEREAVISDLVTNRYDSTYSTTIEVPVVVDGTTRYVLGARIQAAAWQQLVRDTGHVAPGVSSIVDRSSRIVASNRMPERFVGTQVPSPNQTIIQRSPYGLSTLVALEGGYIYSAWDTVSLSGWKVLSGMPTDPINVANSQAITGALATTAACLALGVLLALMVARRVTRPLHQLARNNLSQPMEPIVVREISLLRDALVAAKSHDEMTRELIRAKRDLLGKKADEFETLLASSPIGLAFAQDRQCQAVTHNAAMDSLFGTLDSDNLGTVTVLRDGKVLPREEQPLQRAAAYGETTTNLELQVRVEGREPTFVIVNAVPLRDERGEPRGAIGAAVDITARKAAEARLISAEQRLRESQHLVDLAQETGHVGFFHYQIETHNLAWTPGQTKLFGLHPEDKTEVDSLKTWTRRIDRDDWIRIARALIRAFRAQQEMEKLDYCVRSPDGHSRWLSSRVRIIYSPDGKPQHIIGVSVDMTEQKNAERERDALIVDEQAARIEAEKANRAKDEFLAMLGHELRNPLSAIASGIEVLNRVDGESEVARNARKIIDRQTRHLAHMMDDLLDVARMLTGKVVLPRHPLDLAALVQRVIATLEMAGRFEEHTLASEVQQVWINADATRIEQVVNNLIINATKYTPAGGRIEVRVAPQGGEALLEVKDNGVGIAPELLPRVFDLFVQGERSLDRRGGGLGVGLTLARRLVELHDGHITASNADPGTIMTVRLPAIAAPEALQEERPARESRQRCIAIIEDNEDVLEGLCSMLKLEGHTVWTTTDGTSGLELILTRRPEVAIVDIGLPGLTGYEIARQARAAGYAGKLFALSGYGQERDRQEAFAAGFDSHFLKPVQFKELVNMINSD